LVPRMNVAPVTRFNLALATPNLGSDNDESFIVWVEQAVDRVLSRYTWPSPEVKGTQIITRKPGPEESN
jgi:hypothetical protein